MKPFLTGNSLRKLCIHRVISTSDYWSIKQMKKRAHEPLHVRFNFDLNKYSDRESLLLFRFTPEQIRRLQKALSILKKNRLENKITFSGTEGLCILLRRFSYPNRLSDLVKIFGRDNTSISRICKYMTSHIYENFKHKLNTLNQPWILKNLNKFSDACNASGSLFSNIVGFIDGTCRPICRPKINQKQQYSGYYKEHVLKYQSVVFPNGLIGKLDGAFNGNRHDSAILHLSTCVSEMRNLFTNDDGSWYAIYGDAGYANQKFIKVGFKHHSKLSEHQKKFNLDMSAIRVSVEYGFGKIIQQFAFLDFKKNQKLLLQPLKEQYIVGALLTNCHTCLNGSQVSNYFDVEPPLMEEYLQ